jgi:branched-chain amino acid transport system substrate-binding protein
VNALEGLSFEAPVGMITIRKEDHQAEFDAVAGKTASALSVNAGRKAFRNLDPLTVFPAHEVSIPVSETGCNMQ